MQELTLPYFTLPATDNIHLTARVKYRGTKTQAQVYAEAEVRRGNAPLTFALATRLVNEVVLDWSIQGWKIEALGDGLIAYACACGGSCLMNQELDPSFEGMEVQLRSHYGEAGRARAKSAYSAEKVGEHNRVSPVFTRVYDSESGLPNHYECGKGLTLILGNRNATFTPASNTNHRVRFQKADGTWVVAATYPYIKGNTVVVLVPAGLTGMVNLEISIGIRGSVRTAIYPIPLS